MKHHRRPTRGTGAVAATLACLLLASCSAGSTASGGSAGKNSLSIGLTAEPANFDFTKTAGNAIPQALLYNVYQNLVKLDQSGKIRPQLATSWSLSKDRRTYTFQLVKNATFSNGARFTAEDAKFSIERVPSDWTVAQKSQMDVVDTARAVSPTELKVTLKKPSNDWLYRMTTRVGAMFSRTGVSKLATEPVGTGPYVVKRWNRGDSITLARRAGYWGREPHFKSVTLKYFKDPTALNNALLTGTINVINDMQSPDTLFQFQNNPKYKVIEGSTNAEVVLSLNNSSGPMRNRKARQAVRYAIDHKALMDTCWGGRGKLIGSMVPPTDPWYQNLTNQYPYNRDKAKKLLKESGEAGRTLRLRVPTLPYAIGCGTVVKSQLEQAGFKVKLDQLEFPATWLSTVFKNADYDMSIIGHLEPRDMQTVFGGKGYYTGYDSPEFRALLKKADQGTKKDQITYMRAAARLLSKDAAADWLFLLPMLTVADKDITGLPVNYVSESMDLTGLGRS
ncbi:ABC transporter substrate-binding protein [Streptomyces rapamycinicus]|uniref:ABC transporter, periplasmic substrate-binding protein n=2 Tax=Streptomyces rapamycinicus TaxID=1226757 RepID=A0A0A0NVY3_STRRN|nr:ABC transporter substrate-binding protein [Streptomyces rapamycinicus]AGP61068.1 peptide ABC transporter substrate-binding protein [Streptomyces rapamycinicus NRRL 5491]MBB4787756.1 peptide/nickel transport system substrate-binding protein [Streptomyces rapamycinicus]RLV72095.1 ABC transporter, periplasmic substrate-binding protein [Streptomyces rapamycinicus NRRL 5491]UTP36584.1 ABC transporter substrate-binding protein [Streptomyces rapamycinicus NRRL 5491]